MLTLLAGRGGLPAAVAGHLETKPLVCALDGMTPDDLTVDLTFRLEHLGSLIETLKHRGVTRLCLCGSITRPDIDPTQIDEATQPLVPLLHAAILSGDDSALRTVMRIFESEGLEIVGAHELAPQLVVSAGILSKARPDARMREDAARGAALVHALSRFDVGQACVVGNGQVLGIETVGGTDHMLQTLPPVARTLRALLIKRPKTGQDLRADMPTIGLETIKAVRDAGLAGLVVEPDTVLFVDRDAALALADAEGLIVWARGEV